MRKLALILGILGGAFWISLPFFPPACVPVTELSEDFCNRLWTPALAGMLVGVIGLVELLKSYFTKAMKWGFIALRAGFALMVFGNFAEYWVFYGFPHEGPNGFIRGILWMSVLLGWLFILMGAVVAGMSLFRSPILLKWQSLLFVLPLPLTFVFGFLGPSWLGIPLGLLGILTGFLGLRLERRLREEITPLTL